MSSSEREYGRQGSSTGDSTSNIDDQDHIQIEELALNANFDPSFFDVGEYMNNEEDEEDEAALSNHANEKPAASTGTAGGLLSCSLEEQTTSIPAAIQRRKDPPVLSASNAKQQEPLSSAAASAFANAAPSMIGRFAAQPAHPGLYNPATAAGGFSALPSLFTNGPSPPVAMSSSTGNNNNNNPLPPFLLFDAPIELRANYMACQRAQGIAVHEDTNQLHYNHGGAAVASNASSSHVKLVDGRTTRTNKKVRNVREQKRTQKIADLIDQLRVKMEEGGWKVGMKQSKFHTLSSCGEYVKHLVETNKEKELALEKTKSDLEAKRRKIEEEKNNTTIGSDRESTTSSLTASSEGPCTKRRSNDPSSSNKKQRSDGSNQESSHSSSANSSGGDDSGKQREGQTVSCNRMTSSVSDITGSKGSSSGGNSSEQPQQEPIPPNANPGSILSDAAVAPGLGAPDGVTSPADATVVVTGSRTSSDTSESTFDLDYKEVFVKSNVPQILATTSGRIVAWNDFFLSATGLRKEDAGRLTIFSLVRSNKLSNLFEIVAAALRTDDSQRGSIPVVTDGSSSGAVASSLSSSGRGSGSETSSKTPSQAPQSEGYTAITLPCTIFHKPGASGALDHQLYMTVTLMTDEDPQKRCFHCVFTDSPPGTNGSISTISRELLAQLVSDSRTKSGHHSHKRKRSNRNFA